MPLTIRELVLNIRDKENTFQNLKKAIVDEYLAFLQYTSGAGISHNKDIIDSFKEKANDEFKHSLMFYDILKELGGTFAFQIQDLFFTTDCGFSPPVGDVISIIESNIKGEQCAVASYSTMLKICNFDTNHTKIIQSIIDEENIHIDELVKLLKKMKQEKGL